jgi:hypothetical protein
LLLVLLLTRLELLLLFLKLLLELGVDFLKMHILRLLIVKAPSQGSKFLAVTVSHPKIFDFRM